MAAGGGGGGAGPGPRWKCNLCTYQNAMTTTACTMCHQGKKPAGAGQSGNANKNIWECPRCTFLNPRTAPTCVICSDPKPAGDEPSSAQPPPPAVSRPQPQPQPQPQVSKHCFNLFTPLPVVNVQQFRDHGSAYVVSLVDVHLLFFSTHPSQNTFLPAFISHKWGLFHRFFL